MIFLVVAQLLVGGSAAPTPRVTAPPPPLHPEYQYLHKYTVHDAAARGAVCNDGTPAAFYYRNCTANGDRRWGHAFHVASICTATPLRAKSTCLHELEV